MASTLLSLLPSGVAASVAAKALAVGLNVGLFLVGFRILTVPAVPTRLLVPGAVLGGLGWSALQAFGGYLLIHQLRHASQVYGFFASVLGLVSWLQLSAQLTLFAAELNAVKATAAVAQEHRPAAARRSRPPGPRSHCPARGTAPGTVGHVLLASGRRFDRRVVASVKALL